MELKGKKDETSVDVLVLGGILSDGVGHTHMHVYAGCIHAHKGLIKCLHHSVI